MKSDFKKNPLFIYLGPFPGKFKTCHTVTTAGPSKKAQKHGCWGGQEGIEWLATPFLSIYTPNWKQQHTWIHYISHCPIKISQFVEGGQKEKHFILLSFSRTETKYFTLSVGPWNWLEGWHGLLCHFQQRLVTRGDNDYLEIEITTESGLFNDTIVFFKCLNIGLSCMTIFDLLTT